MPFTHPAGPTLFCTTSLATLEKARRMEDRVCLWGCDRRDRVWWVCGRRNQAWQQCGRRDGVWRRWQEVRYLLGGVAGGTETGGCVAGGTKLGSSVAEEIESGGRWREIWYLLGGVVGGTNVQLRVTECSAAKVQLRGKYPLHNQHQESCKFFYNSS